MLGNGFHSCKRGPEGGYILLVLLLFVALLSIGFMAMVQRIDFQVKRDREEELIHRGVQYARAVRKYVKKFGRYPDTIEELENTNNIRFLRKRYKDPITGKDFRILHNSDIQGLSSSSLGVSVTNIAAQQQSAAGALTSSTPPTARVMRSPIVNPVVPGGPPADTVPDTDASANATAADPNAAAGPTADPNASAAPSASQEEASSGDGQPVFTIGGIVGVASINKDKTIRVFNKQDHYNQWQFVYDPSADKGLLKTPRVPLLAVAVQQMNQDGGPAPAYSNLQQQPGTTSAPVPSQQQ